MFIEILFGMWYMYLFMTKFCNHAILSRIEATWHFVCLPLLYLKILCLFTSHSIVIRYPNRQGFVLQIGNNQDREDCRKVKKHEYRNDVKQNEGYACPFPQRESSKGSEKYVYN